MLEPPNAMFPGHGGGEKKPEERGHVTKANRELSKAMLKAGYGDASNMQQIRMHQASCHNWAVLNKHNFQGKVLDDGLVIPISAITTHGT